MDMSGDSRAGLMVGDAERWLDNGIGGRMPKMF